MTMTTSRNTLTDRRSTSFSRDIMFKGRRRRPRTTSKAMIRIISKAMDRSIKAMVRCIKAMVRNMIVTMKLVRWTVTTFLRMSKAFNIITRKV
jgi:hypothetical protein